MPPHQTVFDLLDVSINYRTKWELDDFAVYMYSIYAHNKHFRFVKMFQGISDKEHLTKFLNSNGLDINAPSSVVEAFTWEYTLWNTAIKIRMDRARDYPRIAEPVIAFLKLFTKSAKRVYTASVTYIQSVDPTEYTTVPISDIKDDRDDSDESDNDDITDDIKPTKGDRKQYAVTLDDIKKLIKNHIPGVVDPETKFRAQEDIVQNRIDMELSRQHNRMLRREHQAIQDEEAERLRLENQLARDRKAIEDAEKEAIRLEQKALREKQKQEEAEEAERLRLEKQLARDRKAIEDAEKEAIRLEQKALREKQKQEEAEEAERLRLEKQLARDKKAIEDAEKEAIRLEQKALREKQKQEEAEEAERLRLEKQLARDRKAIEDAEKKTLREKQKQEEAEEAERLRLEREADRILKQSIREAEMERLALLREENAIKRMQRDEAFQLEKERRASEKLERQVNGILCACGEYYTKSNKVHHQKQNKTHLAFISQVGLGSSV